MSKAKRLIAAAAATAVCAASFTGCSDTTYIMEVGGKKINAGIYIYNIYSEMSYRNMMLYYTEGVTEDFFSQKIEGKDYADYLSDYALKATKEYAVVVEKFEEYGLELTNDELKDINDSVNDAWDSQGDLYEYEGISKESIKLAQKASLMRDKLFDYFYGEGGKEEVTSADMESYLNDNYMRYKLLTFSKAVEGDENADATNAEAKDNFDEYSAMADGLGFEDFDLVIHAYEEKAAAEQEAADSAAELDTDSDSEAESTAADDSSDVEVSEASTESANASAEGDDSAVVSEASDDTSVEEAEAAESAEVSEEEEEDEDTDEAEESAAGEDQNLTLAGADAEEADEEPHEHEQMVNFTQIKEAYEENKDTEDYDDSSYKLNETIYNMSAGTVTTYEDDNAYYIIARGDVSERAAEYVEENHDSLLQEMKADEFQSKIDQWVDETEFKLNNKAIKRYTPKVIYDRQVEYSEKNGTN
ncbi:MAG: hypothetical protein IJ571_08500 [Ruminococcus sp.]|nr:hypothetical protein [Ruminococcus sp.]